MESGEEMETEVARGGEAAKREKASCKSCSRLLEYCYLDYLAQNVPHGSAILIELPSSPQPREALRGKALKASKVVATYRVCILICVDANVKGWGETDLEDI